MQLTNYTEQAVGRAKNVNRMIKLTEDKVEEGGGSNG